VKDLKKKLKIKKRLKRVEHYKKIIVTYFKREKRLPQYLFAFCVFTFAGFILIEKLVDEHAKSLSPVNQTQIPMVTPATNNPLQAEPMSFFHSTWEKNSPWNFFLDPDENPTLPLPKVNFEALVNDPDNRIEPEFKVTENLKRRVLFWMEVYGKYSKQLKVIHDRDNPALIYGYMDFRALYRALGNTKQADRKALNLEKVILKNIATKLSMALSPNYDPEILSPKEKEEIKTFLSSSGAYGQTEVKTLVANLRSQTGQRDEFLQALKRSFQLLPHIETVFRRKGLPVALARIPFVESSFNAKATSSVGAVGIWQFMPETARQMIGGEDESNWYDPLKQTQSAAKLLTIFKSLLPDWGTTVTAYNSGVGRIQKLLKKYKLKRVDGLIAIDSEDGLGFAGQNFFSEFLAAHLVEAYKERIFPKALIQTDSSLTFKGFPALPQESCHF
jgi:membrane-bound lytic murein transglycosylase D